MRILNFIIVLSCFAGFAQNQDITFYNNVNFEARDLVQTLNSSKDSLTLESTQTIADVEIFSNDYEETIKVDGNMTQIDLNKLPAGNFIIKARLGRKHIVMSLEKSATVQLVELSKIKLAENLELSTEIEMEGTDLVQNIANVDKKKEAEYYWVVNEINSNSGSSKTMRLESKNRVEKLILRNKLEQKTTSGKHNKLYVYEIYNTSEFMNKQSRNSNFYLTMGDSKHFNSLPYYYTGNDIRDAVAVN